MNRNHIFVDTNVFIGSIVGKEKDVRCLTYLYALQASGKRLFISALTLAQVAAMFQKKLGDAHLRQTLQDLRSKFNVIAFTDADMEAALRIEATDVEDNIQYVISRKMKCFWLATNNKKDYSDYSNIYVATPARIRATIRR